MTTNIPRAAYALLARGYIAKRTVPDQLPDDVCFLYAPLITSDDLGIQFGIPGPDGFMPAKWIADSQFIIVEGFSEATPAQQGLLVNLADNIGKHRVVFVIEPDNRSNH